MRRKPGSLSRRWSCACHGVLLSSVFISSSSVAAAPDEDADNVKIYVFDSLVHDDNTYRQPEGFIDLTDPAGRPIRGDDYHNRAALGLDSRWPISRQMFKLALEVEDNRYQENDILNNVGGFGRLSWEWQLGGHWSGELGADYDRSLVNFAYSRVFAKDLLEQQAYHGTARYQIGPRWSVYASGRHSESSHSLESRKNDNFESDTAAGGIRFTTAAGSTLDAEYRYTQARFSLEGELNGLPFDRDYNERTELLRWRHEFSPRWLIEAYGGYLDRSYVTAVTQDFSGDVWRASLQWRPTVKTQVTFAAFRELQAYVDAESNYFVGKGASIQPTWSPTEKVIVQLFASYEDQTYLNSLVDPLLTADRRDKFKVGQLSVSYLPRQAWKFDVIYRYEDRDSNRDYLAYVDNTISVAARYTF